MGMERGSHLPPASSTQIKPALGEALWRRPRGHTALSTPLHGTSELGSAATGKLFAPDSTSPAQLDLAMTHCPAGGHGGDALVLEETGKHRAHEASAPESSPTRTRTHAQGAVPVLRPRPSGTPAAAGPEGAFPFPGGDVDQSAGQCRLPISRQPPSVGTNSHAGPFHKSRSTSS